MKTLYLFIFKFVNTFTSRDIFFFFFEKKTHTHTHNFDIYKCDDFIRIIIKMQILVVIKIYFS